MNGWRYLGTARNEIDIHEPLEQDGNAPFDMGTYNLLKTQLAKGENGGVASVIRQAGKVVCLRPSTAGQADRFK